MYVQKINYPGYQYCIRDQFTRNQFTGDQFIVRYQFTTIHYKK